MTTDLTTPTLGESIAHNIALRMEALGWNYERLAVETGLTWGELVRWRTDAADMELGTLVAIADALGIAAHELVTR